MEQGFGAGQTCERFKITTIEYEAINIECQVCEWIMADFTHSQQNQISACNVEIQQRGDTYWGE